MSDQGSQFRRALNFMSAVVIGVGAVGMAVSFGFLSRSDPRDIASGNAGFIAGAVLVGSGLISLALLARRDS